MKRRIAYFFLFATASLLFLGCSDDDPTGPQDEGSFTVSISGDISSSISGLAIFGSATDPESGDDAFVLWFATDTDDIESGENLWFARYGTSRPGTGSYIIADVEDFDGEDWNPEDFYSLYWGNDAVVWSQAGTLQISNSTDNRIIGSFEFSGIGISMQDGETIDVTVEGEFDAVGGNILFPDF